MKVDNEKRIELIKKVEELSGEKVLSCYQCGKCSAGCPVVSAMDILPSQVIRLVQLGDDKVLNCKAIWFCASCFICASRCPRGIDISRIMESLRNLKLRKGADYLHIPRISSQILAEVPQQGIISSFRKFTSY
ncbi:MAG: 4Fe-4S dicluster domain-containing protein [bacterium]